MKRALCFLLSLLLMSGILRAASFSVYDLSCDSESNPVGIDNRQLAFSWKIFSPTRAFVQGAYQLLVVIPTAWQA